MQGKNDIFEFLQKSESLTFAQWPYNYMDAFVLAQFAYLPFGCDMRHYSGECIDVSDITIGQFCRYLLSSRYNEILKKRFPGKSALEDFNEFCELLSKNNRYSALKIIDYSFDNEQNSQFAAFCVDIGSQIVLCYRGTDGSYEGWYENFMMLDENVPAQKAAQAYLTYIIEKYKYNTVHITGHSKGGNLGVYAAIKANEDYGRFIGTVYDFDGPGFNQEFLKENYEQIKAVADKIQSFRPENSVVGELLFGQKVLFRDRLYYVEADEEANFLYQHSLFTWVIKNNIFVYEYQSVLSKLINTILDLIAISTQSSELKIAIELFFGAIKLLNGAKSEENLTAIKKAASNITKVDLY